MNGENTTVGALFLKQALGTRCRQEWRRWDRVEKAVGGGKKGKCLKNYSKKD